MKIQSTPILPNRTLSTTALPPSSGPDLSSLDQISLRSRNGLLENATDRLIGKGTSEAEDLARLSTNGQIARHIFSTITDLSLGQHASAGLPTLTVTRIPMNTVTVAVPVKEGQKKDGVQTAPPLLESRVEKTFGKIAELKERYLGKGEQQLDDPFVLVMGGDHSLASGTLPAYKQRYPDASVVWFDAHADINSWTTSITKNPHGMPVAVGVGRHDKQLQEAYSFVQPELYQPEINYWGLRDLDPGEVSYLAEHSPEISHFQPTLANYNMDVIHQAVQENKFEQLVDEFTNRLPENTVISFDVDGLDPSYTPATGTAVPGGVTLTQSLRLLSEIQEKSRVRGMDMVEVNPKLSDTAGQDSTLSCAGLVAQFLPLNETILDIAEERGAEQARQALDDYCQQLGQMSFEEGRTFQSEHIAEFAAVVRGNIQEQAGR